MSFKISFSKDAIADSTGSFISASGIYPVVIKFASVAVSRNGAQSVNFNVSYQGNDQTIYGPYIADKEGNELEIGLKLINKLGVIAGMGEGDELEVETETHVVGKDKKAQEFSVITNFTDLPVKMRLQEVYSRNPDTGEITSKLDIKSFFREDGATAEEIINETEIGKRLATEQEKYADNITYADSRKNAGDAPTPEEVAEWKTAKAEARKGTATTNAKTPPKATVSKAKTGSLFVK